MRKIPLQYEVATRYGIRQTTSLRLALRIRAAERRDGWPSWIQGMNPAAQTRVERYLKGKGNTR